MSIIDSIQREAHITVSTWMLVKFAILIQMKHTIIKKLFL